MTGGLWTLLTLGCSMTCSFWVHLSERSLIPAWPLNYCLWLTDTFFQMCLGWFTTNDQSSWSSFKAAVMDEQDLLLTSVEGWQLPQRLLLLWCIPYSLLVSDISTLLSRSCKSWVEMECLRIRGRVIFWCFYFHQGLSKMRSDAPMFLTLVFWPPEFRTATRDCSTISTSMFLNLSSQVILKVEHLSLYPEGVHILL